MQPRHLALFLFFFVCVTPSSAQEMWVINTIGGGGPNHVPAGMASIGSVAGVASDIAGNVYFMGYFSNQLVEISGGRLIVLAGNGGTVSGQTFAAAGDGGPATLATLLGPSEPAVNSAGEIFFPDTFFNRIRKIDANGIITTVAGSGATNNIGVCSFDGDGPALQHTLCGPQQVVLDAQGNLFIADYENNRIRKVDTQGNMTTVAGNGALNIYGECVFDGDGKATSHSLCLPLGIALDASSNLYISDVENERVRKVDTNGNMATISGDGTAGFGGDGGPAVDAVLNEPWGLVFDRAGNLYLSDAGNCRIRRIDTRGNISTIAGNGNCSFNGDGLAKVQNVAPGFLAMNPAQDLLFAEGEYGSLGGVQRVREIDTRGNLITITGDGSFDGIGTGQLARNEPLQVPIGLAADPSGNLYVNTGPDLVAVGIRKISHSGVISADVAPGGGMQASLPFGSGNYWTGAGIAADGVGNLFSLGPTFVFKTDASGNTATIAGTSACQFDGDGLATLHSVCHPTGIAIDALGDLFIADTTNCRVREIDTTGNMTTIAGTGFCTFDGDGPATRHSLAQPASVAIDNQGNLYVADTANLRVREVNLATAAMTTIAGNGMLKGSQCVFDGDGPALQHSLCDPVSLAVDDSGDVFVSDPGTLRVREISGGNITTLAGNGLNGFAGAEGGPASASVFVNPVAVALDHNGNLYVADAWGNRVRQLSLTTFAFSASETAVTVPVGGTATYGVQLVGASGFGGRVYLACNGAPKGACTPSSPSVILPVGGSATAYFAVITQNGSRTAPRGTYALTFTATSGAVTHSATVTLRIL